MIISVSKDFEIIVGCLGKVLFKKGNYIYIGSAKGCLEARLRRHLRRNEKIYWHIDYLLNNKKAQISRIWVIQKSIECKTADVFNEQPISEIVEKGFGSSDCKCLTHLFYINDKEKAEKILEKMHFSRIIEFGL